MKLDRQNTDYLEGPEGELEKQARSLLPKFKSAMDAVQGLSAELEIIAHKRGKSTDDLLTELEESPVLSEENLRALSLVQQIAHLKSAAR